MASDMSVVSINSVFGFSENLYGVPCICKGCGHCSIKFDIFKLGFHKISCHVIAVVHNFYFFENKCHSSFVTYVQEL